MWCKIVFLRATNASRGSHAAARGAKLRLPEHPWPPLAPRRLAYGGVLWPGGPYASPVAPKCDSRAPRRWLVRRQELHFWISQVYFGRAGCQIDAARALTASAGALAALTSPPHHGPTASAAMHARVARCEGCAVRCRARQQPRLGWGTSSRARSCGNWGTPASQHKTPQVAAARWHTPAATHTSAPHTEASAHTVVPTMIA